MYIIHRDKMLAFGPAFQTCISGIHKEVKVIDLHAKKLNRLIVLEKTK